MTDLTHQMVSSDAVNSQQIPNLQSPYLAYSRKPHCQLKITANWRHESLKKRNLQVPNWKTGTHRENEGGRDDRDQRRDGDAGEAPEHEALEGGGRREAEERGGRVESRDVEKGHAEAGGERGRLRQARAAASAAFHRRIGEP